MRHRKIYKIFVSITCSKCQESYTLPATRIRVKPPIWNILLLFAHIARHKPEKLNCDISTLKSFFHSTFWKWYAVLFVYIVCYILQNNKTSVIQNFFIHSGFWKCYAVVLVHPVLARHWLTEGCTEPRLMTTNHFYWFLGIFSAKLY